MVVGSSNDDTGNESDFALARYLPGGNLDGSFSGDGKVRTNFGSFDFAESVVLQPDGKIVVVGTSVDLTSLTGDFVVARYLATGTLDRTFNGTGWVITNLGADDRASAVALQPDGKIVVVGQSQNAAGIDIVCSTLSPQRRPGLSIQRYWLGNKRLFGLRCSLCRSHPARRQDRGGRTLRR